MPLCTTFTYWSLHKYHGHEQNHCWVTSLWLKSNTYLSEFHKYPKYMPTIPHYLLPSQLWDDGWLLTPPILSWVSCLHCSSLSVRRMCTARQRAREPWGAPRWRPHFGGVCQRDLTSQNWHFDQSKRESDPSKWEMLTNQNGNSTNQTGIWPIKMGNSTSQNWMLLHKRMKKNGRAIRDCQKGTCRTNMGEH